MNIDAARAHIDAETLAAWADHGLSAEAAADVELHLSNCERCQEMLAAFVRSTPAAGAVVLPFWSRRPVQWSAAGLAAAAALVAMIWIGRPPAVPTPESTVASKSVTTPEPPVSASAPAELRRDKAAPATADQLQNAAKVPRQDKPASAPAEMRKEKALQDRAAANDVATKKTEGRVAGVATAPPPPAPVLAAPPPPPPAATMPPPAAVGGAARPTITLPAAVSESVAVDALKEIPIIEIVAPEPGPPAFRSVAGAAGRGGAGARALSQSAAPVRWRVVAGTRVERSLDAGATWTSLPIDPPLTTALRAGVATSQTNCWLVGRAGVVLVTIDGLTFRRVSLPETVQLVSVIATDALRASVTAIDGRTFSTTDGGLTWK